MCCLNRERTIEDLQRKPGKPVEYNCPGCGMPRLEEGLCTGCSEAKAIGEGMRKAAEKCLTPKRGGDNKANNAAGT